MRHARALAHAHIHFQAPFRRPVSVLVLLFSRGASATNPGRGCLRDVAHSAGHLQTRLALAPQLGATTLVSCLVTRVLLSRLSRLHRRVVGFLLSRFPITVHYLNFHSSSSAAMPPHHEMRFTSSWSGSRSESVETPVPPAPPRSESVETPAPSHSTAPLQSALVTDLRDSRQLRRFSHFLHQISSHMLGVRGDANSKSLGGCARLDCCENCYELTMELAMECIELLPTLDATERTDGRLDKLPPLPFDGAASRLGPGLRRCVCCPYPPCAPEPVELLRRTGSCACACCGDC